MWHFLFATRALLALFAFVVVATAVTRVLANNPNQWQVTAICQWLDGKRLRCERLALGEAAFATYNSSEINIFSRDDKCKEAAFVAKTLSLKKAWLTRKEGRLVVTRKKSFLLGLQSFLPERSQTATTLDRFMTPGLI